MSHLQYIRCHRVLWMAPLWHEFDLIWCLYDVSECQMKLGFTSLFCYLHLFLHQCKEFGMLWIWWDGGSSGARTVFPSGLDDGFEMTCMYIERLRVRERERELGPLTHLQSLSMSHCPIGLGGGFGIITGTCDHDGDLELALYHISPTVCP